ncbi:hypothetical protein FQR65_LT10244 [Abscondita terminalis]|nr:hypothetical protein FQR65_LT17474 [Abscondita terminalis]KAF5296352.1 hypothetical protein FQR65_LT10244 [Abscondita terminalis]
MADPKYADLPGIARDEPDIYETSDLPESDQTSDFYEEENNSIERLQISANEAFNKFKGKSLNANSVDFSERISKGMRIGYDSHNWEFVGRQEHETPLQKYQRLQCEMKELFEEVNNLKNGKNVDSSCLVTGEQVQQALEKLTDLKLEESLGGDVISSIIDPQGAQMKKLLSQLEQFKASANESPESQSQLEDNAIVYQLNYKPEQGRFAQTNRLAELEHRLHQLESILGASSDKLSRLASMTSKDNLYETAQHLCATASMLDSAQLDHIEGRLTALNQKLDSITEKKAKISEDAEKDKMVIKLYDVLKNTEGMTKILPQTIERLKSLEGLHNKATEFAKTLTQISNLQSDVQCNIQNNQTLLQGVQQSFAMNLEEINKKIVNLDSRIKAFKK